jgi:hypothetical protein
MSLENEKSRTTANTSSQLEATEGMKTMKPPSNTFAALPLGGGDSGGAGAEDDSGGSTSLEVTRAEAGALGDVDGAEATRGGASLNSSIYAKPATKPVPEKYRRFRIPIDEDTDRDVFLKRALMKIFNGHPPKDLKWMPSTRIKFLKTEKVALLDIGESWFVADKKEKGIDVDENGGIAGSSERLKKFKGSPDSKEKRDLEGEANRRYGVGSGKEGLTAAEKKERDKELDYLLKIKELFDSLPVELKILFKFTNDGRPISPQEYDKLLRIINKVKSMTPAEALDYFSKITGNTSDLEKFESSLDRYRAMINQRNEENDRRGELQTKLYGLEEVYKAYRAWQRLGNAQVRAGQGGQVIFQNRQNAEKDLVASLNAHGFSSILEFSEYIQSYENSYQKECINITLDCLREYDGMLYSEGARLQDPKVVIALHSQLSTFRTEQQTYKASSAIVSKAERMKGNPLLAKNASPNQIVTETQANDASNRAKESRANAENALKGLSKSNRILENKDLSEGNQLDRDNLSKASVGELGKLLQNYVAEKRQAVKNANSKIVSNPGLVFKLDKMKPMFYERQRIGENSIFDLIVTDKASEIAIAQNIKTAVMVVLAMALAFASAGAATPLIAGVAGIGSFALSTAMTISTFREYGEENDLAAVGLVDDPSIAWLVVAVAGTILDAGVAAKVLKSLVGGARILNRGGGAGSLIKQVDELEKSGQIGANTGNAVRTAAKSKAAYAEVTQDTVALATKAYTKAFPLEDPEVFKQVAKMAAAKQKIQGADFLQWVEDLKQAGLVNNTPQAEELAKIKQAWEQGAQWVAARATGLRPRTEMAMETLENIKRNVVGEVNSRLNHNHYDAARREARGIIVMRKDDGTPFSHIGDLQRNGYRALNNVRIAIEAELSAPSRDLTERGLELLIAKQSEVQTLMSRLKGFLDQIGHGSFPPFHAFPPGS